MSDTVTRWFPCPRFDDSVYGPACDNEEAIETHVALGDYSELRNHTCATCGYTLTDEEAEKIRTQAAEDAPEWWADERAEYLYGRD